MTTEIPVSGGLVALVDDVDAERVAAYSWYRKQGARTSYVGGYLPGSLPYQKTTMHRLILGVTGKLDVDHINGNGLDNRRCNLRVCVRGDNVRNTAKYRTAGGGKAPTSKYIGVSWHQGHHRWQVTATINGRFEHLGYFASEEGAALAYNQAIAPAHGNFARLNVI